MSHGGPLPALVNGRVRSSPLTWSPAGPGQASPKLGRCSGQQETRGKWFSSDPAPPRARARARLPRHTQPRTLPAIPSPVAYHVWSYWAIGATVPGALSCAVCSPGGPIVSQISRLDLFLCARTLWSHPFSQCTHCPKTYSTNNDLQGHQNTHLPPDEQMTWDCVECKKKFTRRGR